MRSSSGRVRASGRRRGCLAASLIVLAACGDNLAGPRLAPARYVYDDGTEQIDRHQLYDRTLETLCTPTEFSDGKKYCAPPTGVAMYTDGSCTRALGMVPRDAPAPGYFATQYLGASGDSDDRPSRVFRSGEPTSAPDQLFEKYVFGCVAVGPPGQQFDEDFYVLAEEVTLEQVKLEPWVRDDDFVVDTWRANALRVPATIEGCDIVTRANSATTTCIPREAEPVQRYADPACNQPAVLGVPQGPWLAYDVDATTECMQFYRVGTTASATQLYDRVGSLCLEETFTSLLPIALLEHVDAPTLTRTPTGTSRTQLVRLADLPLFDDLVRDSALGTDCERGVDGRCVPATDAKVETWFADAGCSQVVDVAMIPTGGCRAPTFYAERDGRFYPVAARYTPQLYQLSTGDTCQIYNPPPPFVAHSIGPALGEDTFARATLMIE